MHKLGIYIPTYNRKEELETCLKHFIPQVKRYGFPIYISDNNSTDGTEELVRKMKRAYPNIIYKKNDTGLGNTYASNLISVLEMGSTEFVWFFGDDDIVKEGAIKTIVDALDSHDFLQINVEIWSHDFSRKLLDRKVPVYRDIPYSKGEHESVLLNAKNGYAGFMAEIITRRDYLNKELSKLKGQELSKKEFLHTTLFFRSIVGKRGKLVSKQLIKYRNISRFGGREFEVWMVSFPKALGELAGFYSKGALDKVATLPTYSMIGITCINKIQNPDKKKTYLEYVRNNKALSEPKRVLLNFILWVPNPIIEAAIYPIMRINGLKLANKV